MYALHKYWLRYEPMLRPLSKLLIRTWTSHSSGSFLICRRRKAMSFSWSMLSKHRRTSSFTKYRKLVFCNHLRITFIPFVVPRPLIEAYWYSPKRFQNYPIASTAM